MTRRALELAAVGIGRVSPSPLVGCVIVAENGEIVGEGTYLYENVIHAEILALKQAGQLARGATAYVSLEPHAHFGRTKPCTDALIDAGIKRVVCPTEDPNPLVSGKGFSILRDQGVEVATGILREEAAKLNEKFCVWHQKNRPFVHLKLAMSLDGRISVRRDVSTALSGDAAKRRVQDFRHEHDAILIGGNTAFFDNPILTDRSGKLRRRSLVRVILDNRLQISPDSSLVKTSAEFPLIVFSNSTNAKKIEKLEKNGVEFIHSNPRDLYEVLNVLKKRDLQSVLVEGGAEIAGAFTDAKLIDKISLMLSPVLIGGSDAPPAIGGKGAQNITDARKIRDLEITRHGADIELTGYPAN